MTELREKVLRMVEEMPEKNLLALLNLIQDKNLGQKKHNPKVNLAEVVKKYSGAAGKMFGSVEKVEDYIKELRSEWDRKF